ncbi:MAG: YkgJ family cysteine cluster protein [Thermoguttaceae bacterium]|nr:YkgJ family cysteine cluster protein [Thermoguttaceae bacterium]
MTSARSQTAPSKINDFQPRPEKPGFPPRETIPEDELCSYCTGKCCRYFALPIDTPENYKQFDFVRWYLLHDRASVFVEDGTWYLLVHTPCKYLDEKNRCGIYETRPQICREYTTKKCEYNNNFVYDQYFEVPEQVEEYANAVLGSRRGQPFRTPKPGTV